MMKSKTEKELKKIYAKKCPICFRIIGDHNITEIHECRLEAEGEK